MFQTHSCPYCRQEVEVKPWQPPQQPEPVYPHPEWVTDLADSLSFDPDYDEEWRYLSDESEEEEEFEFSNGQRFLIG